VSFYDYRNWNWCEWRWPSDISANNLVFQMKSSSTPNNSKPTAKPPKVNINRNVYSTPPKKSGKGGKC